MALTFDQRTRLNENFEKYLRKRIGKEYSPGIDVARMGDSLFLELYSRGKVRSFLAKYNIIDTDFEDYIKKKTGEVVFAIEIKDFVDERIGQGFDEQGILNDTIAAFLPAMGARYPGYTDPQLTKAITRVVRDELERRHIEMPAEKSVNYPVFRSGESLRWRRAGRERGRREQADIETEKRDSARNRENRRVLNAMAAAGQVVVNVKVSNRSESDARNIVVNCPGAISSSGPNPNFDAVGYLEKGKEDNTVFFIVNLHAAVRLSCKSSTHRVAPEDYRVRLEPRFRLPEYEFKLEGEKEGEGARAAFREKRGALRKERRAYFGRTTGVIMYLIAGFIISAVLGVWQFTIAFMCFAVHHGIPPTDVGRSVSIRMERIKKMYEDEIARTDDPDERRRLIKEMKDRLETEKILGETKWMGTIPASRHAGREFMRELFNALGFVFLSSAFVFSKVPLAPAIGILAGFAGYFMLGGGDYHKKKEGT